MEGGVPGSRAAPLDAAERRLPPEPRDRTPRRGLGIRDRRRGPPGAGRPPALLRATRDRAAPSELALEERAIDRGGRHHSRVEGVLREDPWLGCASSGW